MIEKILTNVKWHQLKKVIPDDQNVIDQIMTKKINELVDAVNNQQIQLNNHECRLLNLQNRITELDDPTYHEAEPAENRESAKNAQEVDEIEQAEKWVGKLCWFSQMYGCYQHIAILKRISESGLYVTDDGELHYAYCEPVKPDDDIIYKGGDNE